MLPVVEQRVLEAEGAAVAVPGGEDVAQLGVVLPAELFLRRLVLRGGERRHEGEKQGESGGTSDEHASLPCARSADQACGLPQYRHFFAALRIVSQHCGHSFVGAAGGAGAGRMAILVMRKMQNETMRKSMIVLMKRP